MISFWCWVFRIIYGLKQFDLNTAPVCGENRDFVGGKDEIIAFQEIFHLAYLAIYQSGIFWVQYIRRYIFTEGRSCTSFLITWPGININTPQWITENCALLARILHRRRIEHILLYKLYWPYTYDCSTVVHTNLCSVGSNFLSKADQARSSS